ncbi:MAG: hypothetical protein QXU31_09425 [Archaeoglobaceae archaeon]
MLKRFAPSKKKRKNSETILTPTPNQEGCLGDDDYIFPSDSDTEEDTESLTDEDSIEDYIGHLEDIRRLSEEEFSQLKDDIRKHGIE